MEVVMKITNLSALYDSIKELVGLNFELPSLKEFLYDTIPNGLLNPAFPELPDLSDLSNIPQILKRESTRLDRWINNIIYYV